MADEEVGPCTLKDVSAKDFIRAYASHLRSTGKVRLRLGGSRSDGQLDERAQDSRFTRTVALLLSSFRTDGGAVVRGHHQDGQLQGAGAVRLRLVLHSCCLHRPHRLPQARHRRPEVPQGLRCAHPFCNRLPCRILSHTQCELLRTPLPQVAPPRAAPAPNTTAMPPAACSAKSSSSSKTWASLSARPTAAAASPEPADATSTASRLR